MTLGEKQRLLTRCLAKLLTRIHADGYEVAINWAYRPPEYAAQLAREGKGIANSLHTIKLAVDLDLFKDGKYLARTQDHQSFGEFWETLHDLCTWGGRFGDGNHYSITHFGRK